MINIEDISMYTVLFLILTGFLAGFIDSIVGGGGLIATPALLLTGLPPSVALGTNKLSATVGSLTSSIVFIRSGKVNMKLVSILFPLSLCGAVLGVFLVSILSAEDLKIIILVLLTVVSVYTVAKKDWGTTSTYKKLTVKTAVLFGILMFSIGFYDGFIGGGTGSLLIFAFLFVGFDFVHAAGNAKILNFASNIAALITFMYLDSVHYGYGIPLAMAMFLGSLCGARLAITKGTSFIKVVFITVSIALIAKNAWDMLH
ncbi:sulfite exporter TauE/SafE family protein [Longirhabdus pacifica]|uniref:sulfite exporter TauE/SafE family protein n=1 Tax=Longirhabdus pacifica TaxID=2305227 RepID=UPI0027B89C4D|nr:TSUP family transporter [Longirhabdus pacifica]